jgi:acyl dehydratase
VQIKQAKFHEPTGPGDRIDIEVVLDSSLSAAATVRAELKVEGKRVASAQLMFAMRELEGERVHEQRRYIYRLWTRHFDPPLIIR